MARLNERRSIRLLQTAIRLLPAEFRTRHGSEIIQTVLDCRRDLDPHGTVGGLAQFWITTTADVVLAAVILHFQRFMMSKSVEPAHLGALLRPWTLFQGISAFRHWLARFEPYPKPFRKALAFAWYEAKAYSCSEIQPQHVLLGLLRATKSLRQHIAPSAVESAIAVIDVHTGHGRCLGSIPPPPDPLVDEATQHVIGRALEMAALNRQRLSALHLFLALCDERVGVVSECMDALRLDRSWLKSQLRAA
jgi:hypothetical protein